MEILIVYGRDRVIFAKGNLVMTLSSNDNSDINKELYNTVILNKSHFDKDRFMDLDWFIFN